MWWLAWMNLLFIPSIETDDGRWVPACAPNYFSVAFIPSTLITNITNIIFKSHQCILVIHCFSRHLIFCHSMTLVVQGLWKIDSSCFCWLLVASHNLSLVVYTQVFAVAVAPSLKIKQSKITWQHFQKSVGGIWNTSERADLAKNPLWAGTQNFLFWGPNEGACAVWRAENYFY